MPSIKAAEAYANASGDGKLYMYLFGKKSDNFDFVGACHASELAYVFHNLDETDFSGTVDEKLADKICAMWTNFAKTGNPSIKGAEWTGYDTAKRNTMVIGNDSSLQMESDPLGRDRQILSVLIDKFFWAAGA